MDYGSWLIVRRDNYSPSPVSNKLQKHRRNHQYPKHYTGNAIGGHESDVDATEVVGFYDGVLVNEHSTKYCRTYPIQPMKITIDTCNDDTSSTEEM